MWLGLLGVVGFSFTLPFTRLANPDFGAWTVAFGRIVLAAVVAALVLSWRRQPLLPPREALAQIVCVGAGVVIGFPLFTSLALEHVESAHGAVVTGLIPAATAGMAVAIARERPRSAYWIALGVGLIAVLGLSVIRGVSRVQVGDLLLLAAVVSVGFGYAHGGVLARTYGGWRVICWAVILTLPVAIPITVVAGVSRGGIEIELDSLLSFIYLGVISMCLAFFPWYEGLALGGVARVGRLQLIQPILTIFWAIVLLNERIDFPTVVAATVIIGSVAIGRKARIEQRASSGQNIRRENQIGRPQFPPGRRRDQIGGQRW